MASVLRTQTIAFIGAGTMGQALIRGLLAHGVTPRQLRAADPRASIRRHLARERIASARRNTRVLKGAQVIVLAVKPQQMREILEELAPQVRRTQLVISIAAGITLRFLQQRLPGSPVVRVMPNLPATVGSGFSAYTCGGHVRRSHRRVAKAILGAVGEAVELPERHFDAITAVSGSGPAYLFFLACIWQDAAARLGLPKDIAGRAVRQTLVGSVRLLTQDDAPAQQWITRVASARGTTEAALKVLARERVPGHFAAALRAAARRSHELSRS